MNRMVAFLFFILCALHCRAEIYKCVDDLGNTSFSAIPCPTKKITGDSDVHQLWKTLQHFSSRGKLIVHSVSGDFESIKTCRAQSRKYKKELTLLKGRVDALGDDNMDMLLAFKALRDCGICQARGLAQCSKADKFLDSAKNALIEIPVKQPPPWARKRKFRSE